MTYDQIVFVMSQRALLLQSALANGHVQNASFQLDRLDVLADRLMYGVYISTPDRSEMPQARTKANRTAIFEPA